MAFFNVLMTKVPHTSQPLRPTSHSLNQVDTPAEYSVWDETFV